MMSNKVPMTKQGFAEMEATLEHLKKVERPAVIEAIAEARAKGDLKENAEYHAAREKQGIIEARIADYEGKLSNAQVIDVTTLPKTGKVLFGTTVELHDNNNDKTVIYKIVGEDEADVNKGKISVTSPVARALIGKQEGDEVTIKVPDGEASYEIVEVKYL